MATVQVSNWDEFMAAIAIGGDTVVLPEGEEWDLNEMHPEPISDMILFGCSEVVGNGTKIKNLVSSFGLVIPDYSSCYIHDLSILNTMFTDGVPADSYGQIYVGDGTIANLERFTFSSIAASSVPYVVNNSVNRNGTLNMSFCAFNCELPSASANFCTGHIAINPTACRVTVHLPNSTAAFGACQPFGTVKSCEIVVNAPNMQSFENVYFNQSTLRGNLPACTTLPDAGGCTATDSIFCSTDIPHATGTTLIGVTESQMKDAAYLRSIGFMIGA